MALEAKFSVSQVKIVWLLVINGKAPGECASFTEASKSGLERDREKGYSAFN